MSLSAVASYSTDKGSSPFEQSSDDLNADFFDQFFTFDPIDNNSSDHPEIPDSTLLAKPSRPHSISATTSSLLGGSPAISHHTGASASHFYTELSGRAAISDSELLSLGSISLGSPSSPLSPTIRANSLPWGTSSPSRAAAKIAQRRARVVKAIPKVFKKAHSFDKSLRSPIRKLGHSPKMVRGSENFHNSLDVWGNLLNSKFRFDFKHPVGPSTPPQTARVSESSDSASLKMDNIDDVFGFTNVLSHQVNGGQAEYDTPSATPVLDGHHSRKTSEQQPFSDGMGFPPTPQFHQSSGTWSQLHGSSEMHSYDTPVIHSPEVDTLVWWNHAATAPLAQPSPTALHINPQRATKSLAYQLQNDLSYESHGLSDSTKGPSGLMIQMPESPTHPSFVVQSPHMQSPLMSQQSFFGPAQVQAQRHQYPPLPCAYVPGSGLDSHHPSNSNHSTRKTRSSARHPSPSPSPKSNPSNANFHIQKRPTTKGSKEKRTPSAGAVDFVNFTPSDSRKILTGVAPSGSSKTRARREKEAMEKRRKLSIAALRAVRAAGGDVESLVEQGLFA